MWYADYSLSGRKDEAWTIHLAVTPIDDTCPTPTLLEHARTRHLTCLDSSLLFLINSPGV